MKTIARLLVIGTALVLSPAALAGGYHCMLKVKDFKIHTGNKYELKVVKVGPDRAVYSKQLADWEMVSEKIGKEFTIVFEVKKPDANALQCLNTVIQALRKDSLVEFGFGATAMKAGADGAYHSTSMKWNHKNGDGAICVHGS